MADETPPPKTYQETTTTNPSTTTTTPPSQQQSPGTKPSSQDLNYMHRPPRILPNYGKKPRSCLPKSSVSRVLLYDNVTQQQMLDVRLSHLHAEQRKTGRLMDMHRKSFIVRRAQKQKHVTETVLQVSQALALPPLHAAPTTSILPPTTHRHHHNTHNHHHHYTHHHHRDTTTGRLLAPRVARAAGEQDGEDDVSSGDGLEEGPYLLEYHSGVKKSEGEGGMTTVSSENALLPSLSQPRPGAVTSAGFSLHPPPPPPHPPSSDNKTARGRRVAQTPPRPLQRAPHTLPDIHSTSGSGSGPGPRMGRVVLSLDSDQHGLTRVMHTFHHTEGEGGGGGGWKKGEGGGGGGGKKRKGPGPGAGPGAGGRRREGGPARGGRKGVVEVMTEDERYKMLEKMLVRIEPPNDGYLELSPSFHCPRQPLTFTRPSSLHPSASPSRAPSSSRFRRQPPAVIPSAMPPFLTSF